MSSFVEMNKAKEPVKRLLYATTIIQSPLGITPLPSKPSICDQGRTWLWAGVTGKAKAVVQKADDAVEVSAQKVEGTLRTAAGAAKCAVDTLMGRRSEE